MGEGRKASWPDGLRKKCFACAEVGYGLTRTLLRQYVSLENLLCSSKRCIFEIMRETVQQLLEIQDLELTLAETDILHRWLKTILSPIEIGFWKILMPANGR